ncbi:GNAT family N-acetyltransferase [Flavobacterium sp. PLA-1-15]|uniref:GNAT family N-acetyltransferase n=1 Tax=Flavobacterium sp. PLA-1-15 TaxID=3380533 RepID=UPI003B77D66F
MQIQEATKVNIDTILNIIDQARIIMRENGNTTQWTNGYPSRETILEDIANKHAFICSADNEVVGYFCLMLGDNPDPNYTIIEGNWLNDKPYGVIHRLASGRTHKGIAQKAFDFAFTKTNNIRVDTLHENIPMQNFLKKNGFVYCGVIYVSDGTPRDAFQKVI